MVEHPAVRLEREDGLALVTIDRPAQRNALDQAVVDGLHGVLDELETDPSVGCMILTGAGEKAFAAGADIGQLRERRLPDALRGINTRLFQRIEEAPFPTIAAIFGWCLGGGSELAICCDLRVADAGARFGQPEVGLGIVPGAGATYRLPRLVGLGKAKELVFTGRILDAEEAKTIGLVDRVVEEGQALAGARELAAEILKQDPLAVRLAKVLFRVGWRESSRCGIPHRARRARHPLRVRREDAPHGRLSRAAQEALIQRSALRPPAVVRRRERLDIASRHGDGTPIVQLHDGGERRDSGRKVLRKSGQLPQSRRATEVAERGRGGPPCPA